MLFNRSEDLTFGPILPWHPGQADIRALPQFFRADLDMVRRQGGSFLRDVIDRLPLSQRFRYVSIDSRTHMLMPRMYPCIPGWHCDDFFRGDRPQPGLDTIMEEAPSLHHSAVFGNTSFTEYVTEPIDLPAPSELDNPDNRPIYGVYHRLIEERGPAVRALRCGEVVSFGPLVFHRGTPADRHGWRHFIRVTESNHWQPVNELRTQAQVYLTEHFYEW
ncbi:hypothetical protein AYO44_07475 [Planctomycetaceae bacterium SCGC AG-212-F19]|nr:hypothetical protein AYO44_07475 [Planctomycetaceae bacterium SCGC AG-212-F19]